MGHILGPDCMLVCSWIWPAQAFSPMSLTQAVRLWGSRVQGMLCRPPKAGLQAPNEWGPTGTVGPASQSEDASSSSLVQAGPVQGAPVAPACSHASSPVRCCQLQLVSL